MIRRNLLKGFLTGVAAAVMGRSAKAAPVKPKRYAIPIRPDDTLVALPESHKLRVLRCIRINFDSPPKRMNEARVAIRTKDGQERVVLTCSTPTDFTSVVLGDSVLLFEGDTLVVYTWKSGREVPVSYDAVWHEIGGGRVTYHNQSVRV
jgi:hypothetical protein